MNPVLQQLQAEATRRGMGQPASNAGMQPNPSASQPTAPAPTPSPVAPNNMTMAQPTMPSSGDPFGGASAVMNGSMPVKGGTKIEQALIKRMNMYPPA